MTLLVLNIAFIAKLEKLLHYYSSIKMLYI